MMPRSTQALQRRDLPFLLRWELEKPALYLATEQASHLILWPFDLLGAGEVGSDDGDGKEEDDDDDGDHADAEDDEGNDDVEDDGDDDDDGDSAGEEGGDWGWDGQKSSHLLGFRWRPSGGP